MLSEISKALKTLGNDWQRFEMEIAKRFLTLSSQCAYREPTVYRTDLNGKKYISWQCKKKTDSFDWGCDPESCPYVNYRSPFSQIWEDIEPSAEEAYNGRNKLG